MKKLSKALVAGTSALAMLAAGFVGTSSAFAVTDENTTKNITVTNAIAGDQITAYRVLDIKGGDATDGYVFAFNDNKAAVIAAVNAVWGANTIANNATDSDALKTVLAKLKAATTDDANMKAFAKALKDNDATTIAAKNLTADDKTVAVPEGYYLLEHTQIGEEEGKADSRTKSRYILTTVGENGVEVTLKNGTVTLEKKVKDNAEDTANAGWNDSADYALGDTVPFKLTGTLPDKYADYDTYYYEFQDTLSKGLTYNGGLTVKTGDGTDITSCFKVTPVAPAEGTDLTGALAADTTISVKTANLKACTIDGKEIGKTFTKDTKIVVEYNATLNKAAEIGEAGNPNTAKLVFSNNPYDQGDGKTGTTPDDKVKVFTYKFDGTKTFTPAPNDNDLPKFKLYKGSVADANLVSEVEVKKDGNEYKFGWERLDAGTYVLVESYTPAGFNTAANIEFTITAEHDADFTDPQLVKLETNFSKGSADKATGVVAGSVENKGGSTLPSTGGMGTTILYTVGALIVLAAGAGLAVTLRRRNA